MDRMKRLVMWAKNSVWLGLVIGVVVLVAGLLQFWTKLADQGFWCAALALFSALIVAAAISTGGSASTEEVFYWSAGVATALGIVCLVRWHSVANEQLIGARLQAASRFAMVQDNCRGSITPEFYKLAEEGLPICAAAIHEDQWNLYKDVLKAYLLPEAMQILNDAAIGFNERPDLCSFIFMEARKQCPGLSRGMDQDDLRVLMKAANP